MGSYSHFSANFSFPGSNLSYQRSVLYGKAIQLSFLLHLCSGFASGWYR